MNLLYLHCHDAGRYLSPHGYAIPTPNLMALARESTLFRQAYCVAPTCSPSRVGMLTGMTPHEMGMLGLAHRGFDVNDPSRHLAHHLGEHGYETVLSGVQHEYLKAFPNKGYERVVYEPEGEFVHDDLPVAEASASYLREAHDRPFFLSFVRIHQSHRDFPPHGSDIDPNSVRPPDPLPDNAFTRRDMADYMEGARVMDRCVGIVLEALRENGRD